jgi:hypothetical protein
MSAETEGSDEAVFNRHWLEATRLSSEISSMQDDLPSDVLDRAEDALSSLREEDDDPALGCEALRSLEGMGFGRQRSEAALKAAQGSLPLWAKLMAKCPTSPNPANPAKKHSRII